MRTIDPVKRALQHASRACEAQDEESYDEHVNMACSFAREAEIVALHARGDHSRCAHARFRNM